MKLVLSGFKSCSCGSFRMSSKLYFWEENTTFRWKYNRWAASYALKIVQKMIFCMKLQDSETEREEVLSWFLCVSLLVKGSFFGIHTRRISLSLLNRILVKPRQQLTALSNTEDTFWAYPFLKNTLRPTPTVPRVSGAWFKWRDLWYLRAAGSLQLHTDKNKKWLQKVCSGTKVTEDSILERSNVMLESKSWWH